MINLHDGQITDLFTNTLRHNPETIAVAYAVLQEKRRILDLAERTRLMSAVDSLDEKILDYLAVELRTPAYSDSLPLATKQTLIKGTLPFYAKLGTAAAAEWIASTLLGNGAISEWFEYGGNPGCFRINIDLTNRTATPEELEQAVRGIFFCKNLRSHLDTIQYTIAFPPVTLHIGGGIGAVAKIGVPEGSDRFDFRTSVSVGGAFGAEQSIGVPEQPDRPDFRTTLPVGGTFGAEPSISVPEKTDAPEFSSTLHTGGTLSSQTSLPVPEDAAPPPSLTILRTGGVCTIISNLSKGD